MRKAVSFATLLAPLLAAAFPGCASTPAADARVSSEAYLADVAWLADDARQGRDTDSPELRQTAEWVSERFDEAGLLPLGDETLELRRDWIPLQTAMSAAIEGDVVFAGYGISDPEGGYDDYAGLDVKDKLVLVLRRGPKSGVEGSRYSQNGAGGSHISFATKVNAAFRHGAKGLLVVNGPADFEPGTRVDRAMRYGSLGSDATTASLPAAQLSAQSTLETLSAHGLDLAAAQTAIDESLQPQSRPIAGLSAALTIAADEEQIDTVNVLGLLPGNDASLADEYVLVGAHMDHVGLGLHAGSRGGSEARGQVHNGADDNASGTAGTIEAARLLGAHPEGLRRSIVFATWSGEEWGLLGSQHFVEHPALPLAHCVAVINMDMIGRSKNGYLSVEGVGTSPGFKDLVLDTEQQLGLGLDVALADRPADNSDQASFFVKDIPVLNFFTGLHDDYHMPSDDVDKINADAGAKIATLAGRVAQKLAVAEARPVFTPLAPPNDAVASAHAAPGGPGASPPRDGAAPVPYKVVLGTSPDMGYEKDDGVRISSVRAGTPADKAGLLKGDLIVAFDGVEVRTLQDYATLLFSHKPGDAVVISVVRGEQKLDLTATLEGKAGDA